jgi:AcrR family transcriptional regulator
VRRNEILRSAAVVFAKKGFHAARISDVAARAGVAQGTIYRFFDSKEELAVSVLRNGMGFLEEMVTDALAAADAGEDAGAALERFIHQASEFYARHRAELLALHSWTSDPSTRTYTRGLDDELVADIGRLMERAGDRVWHHEGIDLPRLCLLLLYSLSSQLEQYQASRGGDGDLVAELILKTIFVSD